MTERQDIRFRAADGTELSAWLYLPTDAGPPRPAVTMAHGFGATKEHGLDGYARAFADAGFVVLAHDHRTFGTSGGQPRQDIDPWAQIDDWRRALSYLETLDAVDTSRIGIWGTSYAGGHAIVLGATDRRIRAVVAQVPTIDGYASGLRRVPPEAVAGLERAFDEDQRAQFRGEPARTQKLVDPDPSVPAAYRSQDAIDFLYQPIPPGIWENELTIQSTRRFRMYEPGRWAGRVSPTPLLMIIAAHDTTAPADLALQAYERALEPKSLVILDGGHYSPYLDRFPDASKAAVDWFQAHL
jgi:uncharacterized protein